MVLRTTLVYKYTCTSKKCLSSYEMKMAAVHALGKTVLSGMVERVGFVNKWPMLMKATSDDDKPTPGYLYQTITDLSFESTGYCAALLEFLVARLEKSSFHIKFKVLRVMKHTVENGHDDFKMGLRRKAVGIQNATKFSGTLDPLHGNAPYIAVRKAAMELSEILFDTEQAPKMSSPKRRSADEKVQTVARQCKMQGFGNTASQSHASKSLSEVIKNGVEQLASNLKDEDTAYNSNYSVSHDYHPINGGQPKGRWSRNSACRNNVDRTEALGDSYKAVNITSSEENVGVDISTSVPGQQSSGPGGMWAEHTIRSNGSNDSSGQKSCASTSLSEKLASVSVADWSQEICLVEDFISSSNAKATPSREELSQFSKRCSMSSCEKVLELLNNKLTNDSQASTQMRSLCAIEGIIREDLVSVEKALGTLDVNLKTLSRYQEKLVQAKAKKLLRQLQWLVQEAEKSERSRTTPPIHQVSSLADKLVSISSDISPFSLETQEPCPTSSSTSLFSGMSLEQRFDVPEKDLFQTKPDSDGLCNPDRTISSRTDMQSNIRLDATNPVNSKLTEYSDTGEMGILEKQESLSKIVEDHTVKETLFDDLLDLSTTEQTTLQPVLSSLRTKESVADSKLSTINTKTGECEQAKVKIFDGTITPATEITKTSLANSTRQSNFPMSRTSNFKDLLASIDPLANETVKENDTSSTFSSHKDPLSVSSPIMHPSKSVEEIAQLYPQLSRTQLSGMSAVPLSLGKKPQTREFAFVETEEDKMEKRITKGQEDRFGFVHDAMAKAGKK